MKARLWLPPVTLVSGNSAGDFCDLVVGSWKGSMQTAKEGIAAGVLLRAAEPRLLQDLSQSPHHVLAGKRCNMQIGGFPLELSYLHVMHGSLGAAQFGFPAATIRELSDKMRPLKLPSLIPPHLFLPIALIDTQQALNHLLGTGVSSTMMISHRELWIFLGILQDLVPGSSCQSRSNIPIH